MKLKDKLDMYGNSPLLKRPTIPFETGKLFWNAFEKNNKDGLILESVLTEYYEDVFQMKEDITQLLIDNKITVDSYYGKLAYRKK